MFGRNLSKFKVRKFGKEIEPHEVLLDSLAQKSEREFGLSEKKLEVPLSQKSIRVFWIGFLRMNADAGVYYSGIFFRNFNTFF